MVARTLRKSSTPGSIKSSRAYFFDFRCDPTMKTKEKQQLWDAMSKDQKKQVNKDRTAYNDRLEFPCHG